jgi:hypothetical protein
MIEWIFNAAAIACAGGLVWLARLAWIDHKKPPPPKWRLVPSPGGGYILQRWSNHIGRYKSECRVLSQREADAAIANLEREDIYIGDGQ